MDCIISIIIPVYNAEKFIVRCMKSISVQSFSNYEVLLINDGSTDSTKLLIEKYIEEKNNWFLFSKENSGVSETRNLGIAKAKGDYLVFIDADDFIHQSYLQKLYEPYKNYDVQLTCCGYFELSNYNKNGVALHDFQKFLNKITIDSSAFFFNLFNGVTGVLWGKMFLSKIIKENKIFLNENINLSEDLVFVFEYATHVENIFLVKEHLYYYDRIDENGLSRNLAVSNLIDLQLTQDVLIKLNSKQKISNFDYIIDKRFTDGVVNIIRGITISKNTIYTRVKDLKFVLSKATTISFYDGIDVESKIILKLLNFKAFYLLILFNTFYKFLRKMKNIFKKH